jgi:hypothetical protein
MKDLRQFIKTTIREFLNENAINNEVITNYKVEKESEKASMVIVPYVTGKGDEKSIKLWVPKSVLIKNNGIPKWVISNNLNDLIKKGFKYDVKNILDTIGKAKSELPQFNIEYVDMWSFRVDPSIFEFEAAITPAKSSEQAKYMTEEINYTVTSPHINSRLEVRRKNTQEEAQKVIDKYVNSSYFIDNNLTPLKIQVWKRKVTKEEAEKWYLVNPFELKNVSIEVIKNG